MALKRPFTVAEMKLLDSEWDFQHAGGNFPVEFRADGYNHFVCAQFSAHSHWSLTGTTGTPVFVGLFCSLGVFFARYAGLI